MSYTHGILRCPGNNIKSRRVFLNGANQLKSMSDVQNGICIAEKAIGGKTLQGEEVCTAFLQGCGKNLLWTVMGARSSKVWTSTPPNSFTGPTPAPLLQAAQRFSLLQGGILEHCSAVCQEGSGLCTRSTHVVEPQKFPALLGLCIIMQKAGEKTQFPPRHSTQWRASDN